MKKRKIKNKQVEGHKKEKARQNVTEKGKNKMSRDARKPVFGVSDQVRHKPACTSSEKS